jgi:hypothetical protein
MARWLGLAVFAALLIAACAEEHTAPPEPVAVEVFSCTHVLIGLETVHCREDVVGPGTLSLSIRPDPKETSWELGIKGLAALAEHCEFHGQFDQTRLSALQGRGETGLVCPIAADVDRQYHELRIENRLDTPNTAISVSLSYSR